MIFKQKQGKMTQKIKSALKANMHKILIIRHLYGWILDE